MHSLGTTKGHPSCRMRLPLPTAMSPLTRVPLSSQQDTYIRGHGSSLCGEVPDGRADVSEVVDRSSHIEEFMTRELVLKVDINDRMVDEPLTDSCKVVDNGN